MARITELISKTNEITFSFEVTPDLPEKELDNLTVKPLFFSVTWHAKTHKNENLDIAPLRKAKYLKAKGHEVVLHLSCDLLRKEFLKEILAALQDNNIRNLFIVLGERYDPGSSDFKTSEDLVMCVRVETGEYFCIGVAASPDCTDERLLQLKQKVDSGVDYILTQAFFEPNIYKIFSLRCKATGITVPIIPGIFPFETYKELSGFINLCKIKVSDDILNHVKDKDESKEIPGREITQKLINSISADTDMKHFHLFTINKLARTVSVIKQ